MKKTYLSLLVIAFSLAMLTSCKGDEKSGDKKSDDNKGKEVASKKEDKPSDEKKSDEGSSEYDKILAKILSTTCEAIKLKSAPETSEIKSRLEALKAEFTKATEEMDAYANKFSESDRNAIMNKLENDVKKATLDCASEMMQDMKDKIPTTEAPKP